MRKLTKILFSIFAMTILFCIGFLYQTLNPALSRIQVNEKNAEGKYSSPDGKKSITVYFNGGLIFHNDVTYVGVLEDPERNLTKNIFLVAPNVKEIRWRNNEAIVVNGVEISINDTYDFRDE